MKQKWCSKVTVTWWFKVSYVELWAQDYSCECVRGVHSHHQHEMDSRRVSASKAFNKPAVWMITSVATARGQYQIKSDQFYLYSPKSQSHCLNGLYNLYYEQHPLSLDRFEWGKTCHVEKNNLSTGRIRRWKKPLEESQTRDPSPTWQIACCIRLKVVYFFQVKKHWYRYQKNVWWLSSVTAHSTVDN